MPPKKRQSKASGGSAAKRAKLDPVGNAAAEPAVPDAVTEDNAANLKAASKGKAKPGKVSAAAASKEAGKKSNSLNEAAQEPGSPEAHSVAAVKRKQGKKGAKPPKISKTSSQSDAEKSAAPAASSVNEADARDSTGRPWRLKLASWNINGLRAWLKGDGAKYVTEEEPFVIGVQEIKCPTDKLPPDAQIPGYHAVFSSAEKAGYAGTGLYCKEKPLTVREGIGSAKHDSEGRVITAEFADFYFVTAYVPNSGRGLDRLKYRTTEWDKDFAAFLRTLDAVKPVVLCGDLNVAHAEIDLANPKTNQKTAGFTKEERDSFTAMLAELDLVDTFRQLHPEQSQAYTFWSYMRNARESNIGWRLDYFLVSRRLSNRVCQSLIRSSVKGSDHCPIVLLLS